MKTVAAGGRNKQQNSVMVAPVVNPIEEEIRKAPFG